MPYQAPLSIACAVIYFALAAVVALRGGGRPLSVQVGLMAALLAAYSTLDVLEHFVHHRFWDPLAYTAASLLAIVTLDLVVSFVGRRRELRTFRWGTGLWFTAMALLSASPLLSVTLGRVHKEGIWAGLMLAVAGPAFGYGTWLVVEHAREADGEERARSRLLVSALALGVGGSMVDLLLIAGGATPGLSQLPLLLAALLLAGLALQARVLQGVGVLSLATAFAVALLAALAQLGLFVWAGTRAGLLVGGTVLVVIALTAALRPVLGALSAERERQRHLATMGRFASQMAHDLKNPIAAIRGAAQFLQEEAAQGRSLDPHLEFVEIILERTDRLGHVIADYQRLGRVEPNRVELDLGELVRGCLQGQALAFDGIALDVKIRDGEHPLEADPDLLCAAIENVLRNAGEATEGRGTVAVTLRDDGARYRLDIVDDGPGMDPRTRERALDDFFTTKAQGSGLGLAFAARVAQAHGGRIALHDGEDRGTRVTLELPHDNG